MLRDVGPMAQLLQIGYLLVLPILLGIGLGIWLDGALGTAPWLVLIGLFLGLGLGTYAVVRLVSQAPTPRKRPKSAESARKTEE